MIEKQRLINRKALALFNLWDMKYQKDKHIGDLTIRDFVELVEFLNEVENENDRN